jgi:hypothetical protein
MQRSGLRVPMYLIEGDLNSIESEASRKACKTAAAQTEIWAGAARRDCVVLV